MSRKRCARFMQHRGIFEAVERRDPVAAEQIMREHGRDSNDVRLSGRRDEQA